MNGQKNALRDFFIVVGHSKKERNINIHFKLPVNFLNLGLIKRGFYVF
jgi:hypothetical protein